LASSRTCASCENSIHINNIILRLAFIFRSPSQDLFLFFFWPPILATQIGVGSILVGYPNSRPRRTFHFSYQQFSARLVEFCLNVFTIDYTRVKKTRRNFWGKVEGPKPLSAAQVGLFCPRHLHFNATPCPQKASPLAVS